MEIQCYNRLKIVLAEKEKTGTRLSEQVGRNVGTVSRWMTTRCSHQWNRSALPLARTRTLRDCQASRRGCEGIIGFNEIIRKNYEIYTSKESID
jgi:hypothetical protein